MRDTKLKTISSKEQIIKIILTTDDDKPSVFKLDLNILVEESQCGMQLRSNQLKKFKEKDVQ